MCGISGIISIEGAEPRRSRVVRMGEVMTHRGPDGDGVFQDIPAGVCLGHRRLAIIDPAHGHQPMSTADGEITIIFNGAIYNYLELRRELLSYGHPIRSYSDTEVILYAWRQWGAECLQRFLGMFAFAIWDKRQQLLFCARDRVGIKPFYFFSNDHEFVFASEIKAILASGLVSARVDPNGLCDYLTFQFCLRDKTLFHGIKRLEPGQSLVVRLANGTIDLKATQYWEVSYPEDPGWTEAESVSELSRLLEDAVRIHLRSDVPLGAHLSGGLDSSTVACIASSLLQGERLQTFTGAFHEGPAFDESAYARAVAERIKARYHETYVTGDELSSLLPRLMYMMDEPVAGPGLIPQFYVSKLAAQSVKVVLGGQGGDEIFVGYARYLIPYLEQALQNAIDGTGGGARLLHEIAPNLSVLNDYKPILSRLWSSGLFDDPASRYFSLIDRSEGMREVFAPELWSGSYQPRDAFNDIFNKPERAGLIERMTYFDLKASLPALLHVEDRTSMAVSIESRVPLLDHRLVELAARVPTRIKFASGRLKHVFREAVRHIVPPLVLDRKDKMGFPVPLGHWYKGVARDFVHDTLLSQRARERGLYDASKVARHLETDQSFSRLTWGLLCLELWHRAFIDGEATAPSLQYRASGASVH